MFVVDFESGRQLICADNHILITEEGEQIFAKDSLNVNIKAVNSSVDKVVKVTPTGHWRNMYDLSLSDESEHVYYTNGVLSHNTTIMTIFALWQAMFNADQNIIICAHVGKGAQMIFERIKFAYEEMENWIKEPIVEYNKSTLKLANGSKIFTAATSMNAIRGNSATCLILDEFAFVDPSIAQPFWTAIMPTMASNPNAKLFVSSTPNGVGNLFWKIATDAEKGASSYKLMTVDWRCIDGRDEEWKRQQIKDEYQGDVNKFLQEYECKFLGASDSPFPPEMFDFLRNHIEQPLRTDMNGKLMIWKNPAEGRVYGIGVDIGEGIGKDASVINVLDFTDLTHIEQVACFYDNKVSTTDFVPVVLKVAEMYGNPVMAVERNGCGTEVAQKLYFDNNYPHFVNYGATQGKGKITRAGIQSTNAHGGGTKNNAVLNMKHWLADNMNVIVHDERFIKELQNFTYKGNSWSATANNHDDYVMSIVWALFLLHRDVVETQYVVDSRDADGNLVKISNMFEYSLDGHE